MNQGCTDFPKSGNHVKILEARKVIRSKCPTKDKYRLHRINISRPGDLALRICAPLVSMVCLHCYMDPNFFCGYAENISYYLVRSCLTSSFGPDTLKSHYNAVNLRSFNTSQYYAVLVNVRSCLSYRKDCP